MRIGIFTDSYEPYVSGVVRSINTFTAELLDLGHQIYIFAPAYSRSLKDPSPGRKVPVFRYFSIPAPTYPGFVLPVPLSPRTNQLVRRLGLEVIHSHSPFLMGQLAARVARRHQLPLVFTHHTLYPEYVHYVPMATPVIKKFTIRFLNAYCQKCDLIVAPSPSLEEWLKTTYELTRPTAVIPTGIPIGKYESGDGTWLRKNFPIPEDKHILLFVGRLGKEKNVSFLWDVLPLIDPPSVLVIVGDGPYRSELEEMVRERNLTGQVIFTGGLAHEEVINCYLGADVFVFPSVTETQGLVLAEAMAGELPVVAVDAPANNDTIESGRDGYITPLDPRAFADRVNQILSDPELRARLGRQAKVKAQDFSSRRMAERLADHYQTLIDQYASRPRRTRRRP
ncbi:MAG: glycosyltransferase family 4 protein [Firmicutes bacterium]|jgi:glycosyltransferase involved in cell wall biosynthesis|nr:glycosyltransferase family 4 protein [Bacillota bacterium]